MANFTDFIGGFHILLNQTFKNFDFPCSHAISSDLGPIASAALTFNIKKINIQGICIDNGKNNKKKISLKKYERNKSVS